MDRVTGCFTLYGNISKKALYETIIWLRHAKWFADNNYSLFLQSN